MNEDALCRLCLNRIADKTGSHIIPHFLIKEIENVSESKSRDSEILFTINDSDTKSTFGSAVLPEKLEQVFGEVTEELIQNNIEKSHPLVKDFIFCKNCEDRFGHIESAYSNNINSKTEVSYLLWLGILWRTTLIGNSNPVSDHHKELLRQFLDQNMPVQRIDCNSISLKCDLLPVCSYYIFECPKSEEIRGGLIITYNETKKPYIIVLGRVVVLIGINNNYRDIGLDKIFNSVFTLTNYKKTTYLDEYQILNNLKSNSYLELNTKLITKMVDHRMTFVEWTLDQVHLKFFSEKMPYNLKKMIIGKYCNNDFLGDSYNHNSLKRAIIEVYRTLGLII